MASVNNAMLAWWKAPPRTPCVSDIACKQTQAAGEVKVRTCATSYPLSASERSRASCLSRSSLCCRRSSLCLWLSTEELLKRSNSAWSEFNWCRRVESCFSKSSLSLEWQKGRTGWRNQVTCVQMAVSKLPYGKFSMFPWPDVKLKLMSDD